MWASQEDGEKTEVPSEQFRVQSHTGMPHTASQEKPQKSELWKENLLLISFHSKEIVSGSCLECVLRFHGQASQRLFGGTKKGVAAGQLAPPAAHHGLWEP